LKKKDAKVFAKVIAVIIDRRIVERVCPEQDDSPLILQLLQSHLAYLVSFDKHLSKTDEALRFAFITEYQGESIATINQALTIARSTLPKASPRLRKIWSAVGAYLLHSKPDTAFS